MADDPAVFLGPVSTRFWYHRLYFEALERMEESMRRDQLNREAGAVAFVLTSGAALECMLNDHIVMDLWEIWFDDYKPIVGAFMSMNLRGKLDAIVPLLTSHEYRINTHHKTYQALAELVAHRNRLTHNRKYFEEVETEFVERPDGSKGTQWPDWYKEQISDMSFGMAKGDSPFRFLVALKDFRDKFLRIYRERDFVGNDLVINVARGDAQ